MQRIKKEGYPNPSLYTQYQAKYNWKVQVSWPNPLFDCRIFYYNGEFETIIDEEVPYFKNNRAIPERLAISYIDGEKNRGLDIDIHSFEEVTQIMNELNSNNEEIIMYIELDLSENSAGKVFFKTKNKQIQLKNVDVWNSYEKIKTEE